MEESEKCKSEMGGVKALKKNVKDKSGIGQRNNLHNNDILHSKCIQKVFLKKVEWQGRHRLTRR